MRNHPYLRAYMAGVLLPTWVLPVLLAGFLAAKARGHVPAGLDAAIIFPMAIVPNLWGIWNVLYMALGLRQRVSIAVFGSLLPLLLVPAGMVLAAAFGLHFYGWPGPLLLPAAMAVYYLAWRYIVSFLNRVAGL